MRYNLKRETDLLKYHLDDKLKNVKYEVAKEYIDWIDRQTTYFKESIDKAGYKTQPDNLARGDVIWAEFCINIGTELSDYHTRGHYALVWCVDLGNIIVIPLSSRDSPGSAMTFDLGIIPELSDDGSHSYLKLDAIRSISKRRIARMPGKTGGKVTLNDEVIEKVKEAIKMNFLN